jgi:hypothetical protein
VKAAASASPSVAPSTVDRGRRQEALEGAGERDLRHGARAQAGWSAGFAGAGSGGKASAIATAPSPSASDVR